MAIGRKRLEELGFKIASGFGGVKGLGWAMADRTIKGHNEFIQVDGYATPGAAVQALMRFCAWLDQEL